MTVADRAEPPGFVGPIVVPEFFTRPAWAERTRAVDVWQRRYRLALVIGDTLCIAGALAAAYGVRLGWSAINDPGGVSYAWISVLLVPIWLIALAVTRSYQLQAVGIGADEFKRVAWASLCTFGGVAVVSYTWRLAISRGYVGVAWLVGTAVLLLGRYLQRRWLHLRRRHGQYMHRVLAVGHPDGIRTLTSQLHREAHAGLAVVGACLPSPSPNGDVAVDDIPIVGSLKRVVDAVREADADTVAVVSGPGMSSDVLRQMSWDLQGLGIDLVVAPTLADVAGPRISIRPVAGLPLLQIDEPELSGPRQLLKSSVEWFVALLAFVFLAPVIALLALVVRLDSQGAPLFRQTRVGKHGREFTVYKLRTMRADAEALLDTLREQNDAADGLLFKMRADPRITRVGAWLRKWSLDELPQLWNIVRGDMALVGPRPPLPGEVAQYGEDVARRLLVRPGITGLWQVSGRSNLSWEDSIRLDLHYVENWSLTLDAMIVWKTIFAVVRRHGAY